MSDRWGIEPVYEDAFGRHRRVSESSLTALRAAIGEDPGGHSSRVMRRGASVGRGELVLEEGASLRVDGRLPPDVPFGYHRWRAEGGDHESPLIVSPGVCPLPPRRLWGWIAQLYAVRSDASWGIGDLADLRRLADWSARRLGADVLVVNPLGAPTPVHPVQPSPYFPSSRRWRSPLYLRVEEVPGASELGPALEVLAESGRALSNERRIDRDAVWRLKQTALERLWPGGRQEAAFLRWCRDQGRPLHDFATYCVIAEQEGGDWRRWPEAYRRSDGPAVERFAREESDRVAFWSWLQWLLERQLAAASRSLAIVHDLPIGVDPGGADAWIWQDVLAEDVRVGAPPDPFNQRGQDWGLPPFVPWRLRQAAYRPWIETLRAVLAHGGGLRIDHVMGLFRLFWIPDGGSPSDGAYVRYPARELIDIVALEAHRAGAFVVGEDLGTVERGVRASLSRRNVLSCRLLWFETRAASRWPVRAMASVTTHDLPTVAGLWSGSDLEDQRRSGHEPDTKGHAALRSRLRRRSGLAADAGVRDAILAAHRLVADSSCLVRTATLEDALAVAERPNHPGSDDPDGPSWSLALPRRLEELERDPFVIRLANVLSDSPDRG